MQAVDPFPDAAVRLGGLMDHLGAIRRCRRVLFVGCGTSYHACMACRQTIEQLTNMPVRRWCFCCNAYCACSWKYLCLSCQHLLDCG